MNRLRSAKDRSTQYFLKLPLTFLKTPVHFIGTVLPEESAPLGGIFLLRDFNVPLDYAIVDRISLFDQWKFRVKVEKQNNKTGSVRMVMW